MAFFKFRKGGDKQAPPPPTADSVEVLRKRARHRLIGAAVLVLVGVIGFPLVFDSQPRPVALDIPIEIPDRAKVAPLGQADSERPVASGTVAGQSSAGAIAGITPPAAAASTAAPSASSSSTPSKVAVGDTKPASKPEPKAEPKPVVKPAAKPEVKAEPKADTKAAAKPNADAKPAASGEGRYVVQVGAYAEAASLREARQKVEKIGFKTYTQVVGPKTALRTRVRVGPFATKAEADKAAEKIKKLNLPAAILAL
jgi:DedD protein